MARQELIIRTEHLVLRPFENNDLEAVAAYCGLPDVQRYLDHHARDRADCKAALESMRKQTRLTRPGDTVTLAIVRTADGAVMGHVSLRWTDATAAQGEMRLILNPVYRRNGYGGEAGRALLSLGFERFRLHRVSARISGDNPASARLLAGLGMRLEAHFKEHALFQGEWDEELHFAILDREWQRGSKVKEIARRKVA
jgi:RimJ/RimL family protein N-acetyltransferase